MADTNEAIKSALSLIDEINTAVASLPGRDAEFSTEGVNRVADKIERDGNPILAQCFRDLAIQRDRLAEKLTATPPADAALADGFQEWITDKLLILEERAIHHHRNGAYDVVKSIRNDQKMFEAIAAALRARAVPEGFVMVPVEPTDAMLVASADAGFEGNAEGIVRIYRAMLAAGKEST